MSNISTVQTTEEFVQTLIAKLDKMESDGRMTHHAAAHLRQRMLNWASGAFDQSYAYDGVRGVTVWDDTLRRHLTAAEYDAIYSSNQA